MNTLAFQAAGEDWRAGKPVPWHLVDRILHIRVEVLKFVVVEVDKVDRAEAVEVNSSNGGEEDDDDDGAGQDSLHGRRRGWQHWRDRTRRRSRLARELDGSAEEEWLEH